MGLAGLGESGVEGLGESGGFLGLLGWPGNGNCSAAEDGFFAAGSGGVQGLVDCGAGSGVFADVWLGGAQGGGGFWAGVVCARQEVESRRAACSARVMEEIAIGGLLLIQGLGYSSDPLTGLRDSLL